MQANHIAGDRSRLGAGGGRVEMMMLMQPIRGGLATLCFPPPQCQWQHLSPNKTDMISGARVLPELSVPTNFI